MADAFIHEHAVCETRKLGSGTRVWAFAYILEGAVIGEDEKMSGEDRHGLRIEISRGGLRKSSFGAIFPEFVAKRIFRFRG